MHEHQLIQDRREFIARAWSGQIDGRCWTAFQIAERLDIEPKNVYRHLRILRGQGDPRAHHRPEYANQSRARRVHAVPVLHRRSAAVAAALCSVGILNDLAALIAGPVEV